MEDKILEALQGLTSNVQQLTVTVQSMGKDLADVKTDIRQLKENDLKLQGDMKTIQGKVDNLENNLKAFRAGQQEQTIILGRLEELARVNEAKMDNQMFDHAELAGRVSTVEDTLIQVGTILTTPQEKAQ